MKKLLLIFLFVFAFAFIFLPSQSHAQESSGSATQGRWIKDQEVTFVGKTAARSNDFLEWTLSNYRWYYTQPGETVNPIQDFWKLVRNIVYAMLSLFVLASAFLIVITHGQSLTAMRFIKRFVMIVILIVMAYAVVRFLYQATDTIQDFFLNVVDQETGQTRVIDSRDLLYIAFDYASFTGFRVQGVEFDESAFISLLLVKLTAITYYVMTGILLIRKIILWFFIIVSPVFPLLLFFKPIRNTAKIWLGEFFRWLLYAPLFALFLNGLVAMWRAKIPLNFNFENVGTVVYPTAINILIGGPGQAIAIDNSVNLRDTFALYVVALIMLWVVILLPFLLLQIFLDYLSNVSVAESPVYKRVTNQTWFNRAFGSNPPPPPPGQPPQKPAPSGLAKSLPFFNKRQMQTPIIKTESINRQNSRSESNFNQSSRLESIFRQNTTNNTTTNTITNNQSVRETKEVMNLANLSIPKMRDIARYETSVLRKDTVSRQEVSKLHETLERISAPTTITAPTEREKFTTIKEKLITQFQKGDKLADNVLKASKISEEAEKAQSGVPGQPKVADAKVKADIASVNLPAINQVQQVSIEEYEEVKKMWEENYQNMETPIGANGLPQEKSAFIKDDINRITETINLLSSSTPEDVNKGMEQVANILPFLLIGGFSKAEVIGYLKAKLEAAKTVAGATDAKKEEEDTLLVREEGKKEEAKSMTLQRELPTEEKPKEEELFPGDQLKPGNNNGNGDSNGGGTPPPAGGMPPMQ